jgi:hypothetical protein
VAVGDIYSLVLDGTYVGNQMVNTFGFKQRTGASGFQGQLLIDAFQAGVLPAYLPLINGGMTVQVMRCRDVVPGTSTPAEETLSSGNVGTNLGTTIPSQCAALVSWKTALAGRSYRGRTYIPAQMSNDWGGIGDIQSSFRVKIQTFVTTMLTVFGPSGISDFQFSIISRYHDKAERPTPVATPVTAGIIRDVIATQRKRRKGIGA